MIDDWWKFAGLCVVGALWVWICIKTTPPGFFRIKKPKDQSED
jgi:hypothetical protein